MENVSRAEPWANPKFGAYESNGSKIIWLGTDVTGESEKVAAVLPAGLVMTT